VAHLVCGVRPPFPALQDAVADAHQVRTILIVLASGAIFGVIALLLIESLRFFERTLRRFEKHPYLLAAVGGATLVLLYVVAGSTYAGLGTDTINGALTGSISIAAAAFLLKILATSITLETGGSGGIVTPIFFVGATSGAVLGRVFLVSPTLMAAIGLVAMLAAAANTPIAAAVMAMELLPGPEGVYAALAAATAFLMVGHRSVYASQKIGLSKSAGLELDLGGTIGDVNRTSVRIRKGSLTERVHQLKRFRQP
jgi:H+/Cl- antiporter ClcA